MRFFIAILTGILLLFQYDLWFGKNGYFDHQQISQKIIENRAENEKLLHRNQLIAAEIKGLVKDFESIEERARMNHNLVKADEVFYHIVRENK
ncbi:cell division protein FtsB [Rodentibacter caecimuris]|uniref:Cell division protein FtsB n=1 Tax=Rodentibacter caecimuris TaxID=1796644 RepID=A0ABX3KXG5_9PAST|nr:cell division protein FtsB [Rodentibacter heylii]